MGRDDATKTPTTFALVSHESAVEAIWALAQRRWQGVLDNEGIWLVPDRSFCVRTQGDLKRLGAEIDLEALGIRHKPLDLLVPDKSCYSRGKRARFHVWAESFPPRSFVRVHERVFVSTPYFAVIQLAVARRASRLTQEKAGEAASEDARLRSELGVVGDALSTEQLVQWENIARLARATQVLCDFMGTYRYVPSAVPGPEYADITYKTKPLVTPDKLDVYLKEMSRVKGITRAREVAELAFANAASPMETMLALMLCLPTDMGGFGLPRPELNFEVPISPERRGLSSQNSIVADLCWPDQRVIVEYYGWEEHFGAGQHKVASDATRSNSLTALGWTVLHVTFEQAKTTAGMTLLARQVAHTLGMTLLEASDLELIWRSRLLALLLPKVSKKL